jgi:hypothetical protein
VTKPRILRLSRPYDSVEEYVANEGWSISTKRMILIDQPRLERDTIVRFEVSLTNKEKVIRAEARVVGYQAPEAGRPGGPKVRFKRFGGTTKSFIQRVVAEHGPVPGLDTIYPSSPAEAMASVHPAEADAEAHDEAPSDPEASSPEAVSSADAALADEELTSDPRATAAEEANPAPRELQSNGAGLVPQGSPQALERLREHMQARAEHCIDAPPDRESLLERLRERARSVAP